MAEAIRGIFMRAKKGSAKPEVKVGGPARLLPIHCVLRQNLLLCAVFLLRIQGNGGKQ